MKLTIGFWLHCVNAELMIKEAKKFAKKNGYKFVKVMENMGKIRLNHMYIHSIISV